MDDTPDSPGRSRRQLLAALGGLAGTSMFSGVLQYRSDRSYIDSDNDGIPDLQKRSGSFHRYLQGIFGSQFEGLEVGRQDLLLDVRYVGDVDVPEAVKRLITRRFRTNGIYLQWLDYPERYDDDWFHRTYGNNSRKILWSRESFYREEIEEDLKDVALQFILVPGEPRSSPNGRIYSPWANMTGSKGGGGYINGMNFGNRAVAAEREETWEQTRLIFHELAHLALCHDSDPENTGVMGTNETLTLTDAEWRRLRQNLDNVRDTSGYDVFFRTCLWSEDPGGLG